MEGLVFDFLDLQKTKQIWGEEGEGCRGGRGDREGSRREEVGLKRGGPTLAGPIWGFVTSRGARVCRIFELKLEFFFGRSFCSNDFSLRPTPPTPSTQPSTIWPGLTSFIEPGATNVTKTVTHYVGKT